jgi:hypothetical protein
MAYTHSWLAKDLIVDAKNRIKKKKKKKDHAPPWIIMASKKHKATNRTISSFSTPTTTKQAFFFPSKSSVQVNLALPKIPIHLIKSEANSYKASSILNPMHTHT